MRKTDKNHTTPNERNRYRPCSGYRTERERRRTKDSEDWWEEDGRGKGKQLILQTGEFARQWEQHVQRLRGEKEADRLKNKEENSVAGAEGVRR